MWKHCARPASGPTVFARRLVSESLQLQTSISLAKRTIVDIIQKSSQIALAVGPILHQDHVYRSGFLDQ